MKKYTIDSLKFRSSYKTIKINSLQFENFCQTVPVNVGREESKYGIKHWENELLTTYLPTIIEEASVVDISSDSSKRTYHMNPWRLSRDYLGVSDYWYVILTMNNYTNIYDFKDFREPLLLPNVRHIDALITTIERERL